MPRDPELMAKLDELRKSRPEDVSLDDLVGMCVLLERHENEQHREYASIAREEGHEAIAKIFEDLAEGEDFYHRRMEAYSQEVKA